LFRVDFYGIVKIKKKHMSEKDIIKVFKKYRKASGRKQQEYLRNFEEKMIYRTTKTENPKTTLKMVRQVLSRETTPPYDN